MTTMNNVIKDVDRLKPNVYTDDDKFRWINTLEGMISREVMQTNPPEYFPGDADTPLLVDHPFDDLYGLYVMAMIDFHNREFDHYNNTVSVFQNKYDQYKAWYIRSHEPESANNFRNVMG